MVVLIQFVPAVGAAGLMLYTYGMNIHEAGSESINLAE